MSVQNVNTETGIRYGVLSANNDPDLYAEITTNGIDQTFEKWKKEIRSAIESCFESIDFESEELPDRGNVCSELIRALSDHVQESTVRDAIDDVWDLLIDPDQELEEIIDQALDLILDNSEFMVQESTYTYSSEDFEYLLTYLGGSPLIFVMRSPHVVKVKSLCSPCVPNAGDLDSGLDPNGFECYGLKDPVYADTQTFIYAQFHQMSDPQFITDPRGLISVPVPDISDYENANCIGADDRDRESLIDVIVSSILSEIESIDSEDLDDELYDALKDARNLPTLQSVAEDALTELINHARSIDRFDWSYDEVRFYFTAQTSECRIYTEQELRDLDSDGFDYAAKVLIENGFIGEWDEALNDPNHPLHGIDRHDFERSQEDIIITFFDQLDDLECDYAKELKQASAKLVEIVNNFVSQWGSHYSLDRCFEAVQPDKVYYLMVMSALHHGVGLWENIGNDLGTYSGSEEGIEVWDLIQRIAAKYTEDDRE